MGWDKVVAEVKHQLPQFNDDLLINFRKTQVNSAPEFMDKVFSESVRTIQNRAPLNYIGYRILKPDEQAAFVLGSTTSKDRVNIQRSELQLCEYVFEFEGERIPVYLFLPYLFNNKIVINDTEYCVLNNIIDRLIVRITEGVIVKVMKQPINFWRNKRYSYKSVDGVEYHDTLITVKAYGGKKTSNIDVTVVLYLLAEYGFEQAMRMLSVSSISFVDVPVPDDEVYSYFKIDDGIYLKTSSEDMLNTPYRRIVASILYSLTNFTDCILSLADTYQPEIYRMILGKCHHGKDYKATLAAGHCESHLESLRTYLDEITKNKFYLEKRIPIENIFQLFVYVFYNIDDWLVGYSPNDLFEKRLGGIDSLLMHMVEMINNKFYATIQKNKQLKIKQIRKTLKFNPMAIANIYKSQGVQSKPSVYNDNELFSMLIKRVRPLSSSKSSRSKSGNLIQSKEHQFNPSFIAIESAWAISSSSPGISGDMNPFAVIDESGRFRKDLMPWYKYIESLSKYLVQI